MREVIVAKHAGFCFGVQRAVQTAYDLLAAGEATVYALGHLIHNPQILAELAAKGMQTITEAEIEAVANAATPEHPTVLLIRAHGIPKGISEKLTRLAENPSFSVADCTCPYVKNIHDTVAKHTTPETVLVVIGDPAHPEVQGITAYAKGEVAVFDDLEALASHHFHQKRAVVVAQTTQNLEKWEKSQKILEKLFTNVDFFDTICNVTERRQTETAALARAVDLMLCIGGRESSNTRKLYEIAKAVQPRTYFVEQLGDLPTPAELAADTIIGITAGASTPSRIIEEAKAIMEDKVTTTETLEENFAELLEGSFKTIHKGEVVEGIIASVSAKGLQLDLGAKVTGFIPADELSEPSEKLTEIYKVGDTVSAKVIEYSDKEGSATLSKKRVDALRSWDEVKAAYESSAIVEGTITREIKGGLLAAFDGTEIFIPASQSGLGKGAALAPLVGTTQKFRITEVDEKRRRAVGSIRVVLSAEKKEKEEALWATIEEGAEITGPVRSLVSYGAFVDLGGVDGLVHITELSWRRLKHPSEVLKVGDVITVRVKGIDREKKRISLGYKTEESNPWTLLNQQYAVGSTVSVKIVNLTTFGAFAEIIPGVDGLIHISQIADRKLAHPSDVLKVGDVVDAKITAIDDEKQNVSLSMRALVEETATAEDVDAVVASTDEE